MGPADNTSNTTRYGYVKQLISSFSTWVISMGWAEWQIPFHPLTPLHLCYPDYMALEKIFRDAFQLSAETPLLERVRIALQGLSDRHKGEE
jgi:hypothetical protein